MTDDAIDRSLETYRRMFRIREFEAAAKAIHAKGEMVGNHRSHGHPIAKGAALRPLFAELLSTATKARSDDRASSGYTNERD
jgi:acetoin:2,6-dichlorophenolindophenol oxidoreductase subunit alpha